jgi:protein phosphatase
MSVPFYPEIESSGLSHIGPVREENQDAIQLPGKELPIERGLLFAIADGMGGYMHGGMASKLALDCLIKTFYAESHLSILKALRRGVEASNLAVYNTAQRMGQGRMGTTLTAAVVANDQLFLAHVGDSRAYLIRNGRVTCLTDDHTTVGDLVRMKVLSPDKVRTHAQRSILNRCIGLSLFVQPDLIQHQVQDGDRLVMCSDGIWSVIQDEEFAELAQDAPTAHNHNQRLIDLALERQTDDNVSAISVHLQRVAPAVSKNGHRRGWHLPDFFHNLLPVKRDSRE